MSQISYGSITISDLNDITEVKNWYLATSASSGVTKSTSGWKTTIQTMDATNQYLWNYEEIMAGDTVVSSTDPVIIGRFGKNGKGISSITEYYCASDSTTAPADSSFSTTVQTTSAANPYLWNYELITYTEGNSDKTDKRIIGTFGPKGDDGDDGKMLYGTSSTAAGTAAKVVTCDEATTLYAGLTVLITFSSANTAAAPTLKVGSTTAKNIYFAGANASSTNLFLWGANTSIAFTYNGTAWEPIGLPSTYYGTCTTASGTAVKASTINNVVVCKGSKVGIQMTNANTVANATLNISSTGAKTIYANGIALTANSPYNWIAGATTSFVFDGQYWRLENTSADYKINQTQQHFWYDSEGAHSSYQTQSEYASSPSGPNTLNTADGMQIRSGTTVLSEFAGDHTQIGSSTDNHSVYNATGAYWYTPSSDTPYMAIENGTIRDSQGYNYWNMLNGNVRWGNANSYLLFNGNSLTIQAESMSFKPTGSSTYKTVENAINDATTEAMDNLQIGGRNLLYDTNAPTFNPTDGLGNRYWSDIGTFLDNAQESYWGEIPDSPVPSVKYGAICNCTATGGKHHLVAFYNNSDRVRVVTGETYTMSFWAKTDTPGAKVAFGITSGNYWEKITDSPTGDGVFEISAVDTWEKFVLTFKYIGTATTVLGGETVPNNIFYMGSEYNVVGKVWLCGFKLELGNQDTDWVDYDWNREHYSGRNLLHNTNTINLASNDVKPNINGYYNDGIAHYGNVEYQGSSVCNTIPSTHGMVTTCLTDTSFPMFGFGTSTTGGAVIQRAKGLYGLKAGGTYTLSADVTAQLYSGYTKQSETLLAVYLCVDNDGNNPQLGVTPDNYYLVMPDDSRAMFPQDTSWKTYIAKPWLKWEPGEYGSQKTNHATFTFTLPPMATRFYLMVKPNGTTSGYHLKGDFLELRNIKLEEGDYGTSWSPAPEDIDKDMAYIQNVAEITNNISTSNAFYVDGGWIYDYLAYSDVDCDVNDSAFVDAIDENFTEGQYIFMCGQTWMLLRDSLDTISPNLLMSSYIRIYASTASGESLDISQYETNGIVKYTRNATTNKGFYINNYSGMKPNTTYTIRFLLQKDPSSASNITKFYLHANDPNNVADSILYIDGIQYGSAINTSYPINIGNDSNEFVINFTTNSTISTGTYAGMILQFNKDISNSYSVVLSQLKLERNTYATDWSPTPTILNPNVDLADYGITLGATPSALDNIIVAAWKTENLRGETYELKQQLAQLAQRASQMQSDFYNVSINTAYQVEAGFEQANNTITQIANGANQTAQGLIELGGKVAQIGAGMENIQGAMPQLQSICKDVFADADGLHVFGFDPEVDTTNQAIYLTAAEVNIKPDRISFRRGMAGNAVAWVGDKNDGSGNYKLYIQEAEVRENVRIGDLGFVPRSNGNMCLKFIGGDDALGWIVNKSTFAGGTNPGECYFHGYDAEGNANDINGYVYWDNKRVLIPKGYAGANPNAIAPYNTTIYVIYRTSNSTFYNAWLEGSTWYGMSYATNGTPNAKAAFTWSDSTDIVIGYYVEPSNEGAITECVLYSPVKSYSQITSGTANPNLLRGTHTISSIGSSSAWSSGTWRSAGSGTGTRTIVTTSGQNIVPKGVQFDVTNTPTDAYGSALLIGQNSVPVEKGKTYTISCYAKGKGMLYMGYGISMFGPIDNSGKINIDTNTYRRFSATFTAQTDNTAYVNDNGTNVFFGASVAGTSLTICTMKLEEGTLATDWCPSEHD